MCARAILRTGRVKLACRPGDDDIPGGLRCRWLAGAVARSTNEAGGTFRRAASLLADAGRSCRVSLDMAKSRRVSLLRTCCGADGLRGRLFHVESRQNAQQWSPGLSLTEILVQRRDCSRRNQAP